MGTDIIEEILGHPEDPAGAGLSAAFDAAIAAGVLTGVRLSPDSDTMSHLHGVVDERDAARVDLPDGASLVVSPSSGRPAAETMAPVVATVLAAERATVHRIVRTSATPVSIRRADGSVILANQAWGELTGRTPAEATDSSYSDGVHPEDVAEAQRARQEMQTSDRVVMDIRLVRPDGTVVPIRAILASVRWPSGQLRYVVSSVEDRSEIVELHRQIDLDEQFRQVLDHAPLPVAFRDSELRLLWANERYRILLGRSLDELTGTVPDDFIDHDDYSASDRERLLSSEATRSEVDQLAHYVRPDGELRLARLRANGIVLPSGERRFVSFAEDLTDQRREQAEARRLQRRLDAMLEHAPGVISLFDPDLELVFTTSTNAPNVNLREIVASGQAGRESLDRIEAITEHRRPDRWLTWVHRPGTDRRWIEVSGAAILDDHGELEGVVTISIDRTEQILAEDRLAHDAVHDSLTGLSNRPGLIRRIDDMIEAAQPYATLTIDLDQFQDINNALGHTVGDELIQVVAGRIAEVAAGGVVARLGGDEFAVALPDTSQAEAARLAERILDSIRRPVVVRGATLAPRASIGVGGHGPEIDLHEALRRTDLAMCEAKRLGRNRVKVFDVGLEDRMAHRTETERGLRRALERDELVVFFQPEYDLCTGELLGAEALLRWDDPGRGRIVAAGEFVEIAEQAGLIGQIGRFAAHAAIAEAATWPDDLTLRLNVSARQLDEPDLAPFLLEALAAEGLPATRLCVELTETAIADQDALGAISVLSEAGVTIALDDFGTGFSSLSLLRALPVDVIKIDRSFVDGLGTDPDDTAVVRSIVGLGEALGLGVVAEGVENELHVHELRRLGCRNAQGFGLAVPMPADGLRRTFDRSPPQLLRVAGLEPSARTGRPSAPEHDHA